MRYLIAFFTFLLSVTFYGQNDYSMSFDGVDDYVEAPSISHYDTIRHYLTLSSWIRLDNSWSNDGTIVARRDFVGNPTGERHHFQLTIRSDKSIYFSTQNNQNNSLYTAQLETLPNVLEVNTWHYVSCTFINGEVSIYVDGSLIINQNFGDIEMYPNNHWINFGRIHRSGGTTFFHEFNGEIANVEMWATPLSQQEIQQYMSCPPTGNEEGLVGYWNFEEGSGTTAYDLTSNGNDGAINGATYSTDTPEQYCVETPIDDCAEIDLILFHETGQSLATQNAITQYQNSNPLTSSSINIHTVDLEINQDACSSMSELLTGKDVAVFIGDSNIENCNWLDVMPQLDEFTSNGGEIIFQGNNAYDFMFNTNQWQTILNTDAWFGSLTTEQYYPQHAAINLNCSSGDEFFSSDYSLHPIFTNAYDYSNGDQESDCDMSLNVPYWYNINSEDLNDINFFSIFDHGGDAIGGEVYGEHTQIVFGKKVNEGHVIIFGDNYTNDGPPEQFQGSSNLLGNIIHYFTTGEYCADSSINVEGCTDANACNYDALATQDNGSCEYITPVDLGDDITTCDESVTLDAGEGYDSYLWSNGETTQSIEVSESGDYSVEVGNGDVNNSSLSFDGVDDQISVPNNNLLNIDSDFSLQFDIKTTDSDGAHIISKSTQVSQDGTEYPGYYFVYLKSDGTLQAEISDGYSGSNDYSLLTSGTPINDNVWHGIVITFDRDGDGMIYVDGQIQNSVDISSHSGALSNNEPLLIGGNDNLGSNYLGGLMGNFSLWGVALSSDQILGFMSCQLSGTEEGLVGYWNFDEGSGTTAYDLTGNGNDGAINGATWSTETPEQSCSSCSSSDEITVTINPSGCTDLSACNFNVEATCDDGSCEYITPVDLGEDITTCDESVTLDAGEGYDSYLWSNGETTQSIEVSESGDYSVEVSLTIFNEEEIGQLINGGYIFYNDTNNGISYVASEDYVGDGQWGCYNIAVNGSDGHEIGDGQQNTLDILAANCVNSNSAAVIANSYSNGFDDWYLPSLNELELIYNNLFLSGIVNYDIADINVNNWYWSSTESSIDEAGSATNINFNDGFIAYGNNKNSNNGGVIAVRSFNSDLVSDCSTTDEISVTMNDCGCTDDQACNFNENAVEDDGSCEYITPVDLGEYITTCDESVTLDAGEGYDSYLWSNGETTQSIEVSESGDYSVEVGNGGVNNYSMSFDGTDDNISLDNILLDNDFSFESWVYIDSNINPLDLSWPDAGAHILSIGASNSNWASFAFGVSNVTLGLSQPTLVCELGSPASNQFIANTSFPLGQWNHVAITINNGNMDIYQNGVNVFSVNTNSNISNNSEYVYIGSRGDFWDNDIYHFQGEINNISYWDYSLSEDEIQSHLSCPIIGNETGLVSYWNFDEGSGGTAFDQTGNGNNGTINGATWSNETPEQNCSLCSSTDEITVTINVCGCTDSEAVNYNMEANQDDSSCCYDIDYVNDTSDQGYSDGVDSVICPENNCPADLTLDGIVSTADLLMFLVSFGTICE